MNTILVPTKIKSQELIDDKREKIIKGALSVFKKKGYHKTTVRDIANAAGISMGSLYDYINSKEDILFLFHKLYISTYYKKVIAMTQEVHNPGEKLRVAYRALVEVGFSLEEEILFGWTETKNMKKAHLKEILRLEAELVDFFKGILEEVKMVGPTSIGNTSLAANFLVYSATFGIFRRWILKPQFKKEDVIDYLMNTQLVQIVPGI